MIRRVLSGLFAAGLLAGASPVLAQQDDGWRFRIAPYVLAPSMQGDVTLRGRTAEADIGPTDVFSALNFGFQGYVEARTDDWGFGFDALYMNLDATDDSRIAEIDVKQLALTPVVFGRIASGLDLYAGARFNSLGGDIDFHGPLDAATLEQDKSWVDPLVGARFATSLGEKWNFEVAGDVGGFGLSSDIAINVWTMVGYEISDNAQLTFGYRVLYMDYDSGSGTDLFAYDMLTMGPVVGAVIGF